MHCGICTLVWFALNFVAFLTNNHEYRYRVVEDFIGEERLMTMIGGGVKVRKQAKKARGGERDIIIATPGRVMQLVSMNIIRYVGETSKWRVSCKFTLADYNHAKLE